MNKDEAIELIKREFRLEIIVDDTMPAFGANWILEDPEAEECDVIALNLGACLLCSIQTNGDFKEIVVETLMHEFGHCVERWVGLEANEERIEAIVEIYRQKYGTSQEKE